MEQQKQSRVAGEWVAIILAGGMVIALNIVTLAMMYTAVVHYSNGSMGLSENGVQLLTGWGGGVLGILGAYVGYSFGKSKPVAETSIQPASPPKSVQQMQKEGSHAT
jgi:hypothetical protein